MPSLVYADLTEFKGDLDRLMAMYSKLPDGLARKHLQAALKRSMKPHLGAFRTAAPVDRGGLKKSVGTTASFRKGIFEGRVGYMRSKAKRGFTAAWINDGTDERITKDGENRGRMRVNGFGDRVTRQVANAGIVTLKAEMLAALEKAVNELPTYLLRSAKFKARRRR
jgi:hypothetical protein